MQERDNLIAPKTLASLVENGVKLTPMMEQYYSIKKEYPDTLLLFRMGDFYELFFEDAVEISKILNIALTHRGKIADIPIPMAGIPHHAANAYVDRITSQGKRAAICEQIQDPKEAKGIVLRAVTQIVGPGLPYDIEKVEGKESYYIASAIKKSNQFFLTIIDFTTGEFFGEVCKTENDFLDRVNAITPKEFLSFMGQWRDNPKILELFKNLDILKTHLSEDYFEERFSSIYIEKMIPTYKKDSVIKSNPEILDSVGALAYYILSTQKLEKLVQLRPFQLKNRSDVLKISSTTLKGLEILPKSKESHNDSLLGFFDRTETALGARMLKSIFSAPLKDETEIKKRQELIKKFIQHPALLKDIKVSLSKVRDIERILTKVSISKANGNDLIAIAQMINAGHEIVQHDKSHEIVSTELKKALPTNLNNLKESITSKINDEIGATLDKGNLIRLGANQERDRLASLALDASKELSILESRYRDETGISNLKIRSNNINGYYIEISKSHTNKVPKNFERRQTLVNGERYTTKELTEFEREVITANEKLLRLDREIFKEVIDQVMIFSEELKELATRLAFIDVMTNLASVAIKYNFTCPTIFNDKKILKVKGAWHPLIKSRLTEQFVTHDLTLDDHRYFGLITGPNMAGKTTVMREMAIIQLLTQIGSFVPAAKVDISICDFIFSRLGASDDILRGQSTFMVEMCETAEIIRHATDRSLIILDEVGRGTSTYDGLSIAWALTEHLINKTKAITLFATHYHELIDVANASPFAKNLTVATIQKKDEVEFLYRLIEGGAEQSFGIYVAKLAGLPTEILKRASKILSLLEKEGKKRDKDELIYEQPTQLTFFDSTTLDSSPMKKVEEELLTCDPMNMTPMQALSKLQELKDLILK